MKAKILAEVNKHTVDENGKPVENTNKIAIIESKDVGNKKFTFAFADGSEVIAKEGRIISDTRTFWSSLPIRIY